MLLSLPRVGGGQYKTHSSSLKLEIQLQILRVGQNTERDWRMNEFPHTFSLSPITSGLVLPCQSCSTLSVLLAPP